MQSVFTEVAVQHALAKAIENLGRPNFWQCQLLLLRCMSNFENALITLQAAGSPPRILHAYSSQGTSAEAAIDMYLGGLYLLDPFYQACCGELDSGLYLLEEVAPDRFLQSEYFASYFNDTVGSDEVQLILDTGERQYLSISLGLPARIEPRQLALLQFHAPTLLALMRSHWRSSAAQPLAPGGARETAGQELQVERALEQFGCGVLSARELEIARLVLRGNSSKAISAALGISNDTVKVHRRHLYSKLGISSQSELFNIFLKALA